MTSAYEASPQRIYERRAAAIDSKRTPAGGFTRAQLAEWNIKWPPQHGWKQALIDQDARALRRFALKQQRSLVDPLVVKP